MALLSKINLINSLINEIDEVYHEIALKLGLSDSAMWILYSLCTKGGKCMLGEVVNFTNISKQTINSALRKLEAEGVIFLEAVGVRKKAVCLTDKGKELSKKTVKKLIDAENKIYDMWTKDEFDTYVKLTGRFLDDIKNASKGF